MFRGGGSFDLHKSCLMLVPFLYTGLGTFGNMVGNLASLATACLTGDKDPPGIFQGAWKYPGSWNFPGGLEISRT